MSLSVLTFPAGPIETNAYLVIDDATKKALIIDAPHGATDEIIDAASKAGATIEMLYITHAHWDHVGDAAELRTRLNVPLLAHRLSEPGIAAPDSWPFDVPIPITPALVDRFVADGDTVILGDTTFVVMHLPGHEPGHTALYSEDGRILLGGDVLFPNGHGRIDIPLASETDMAASMKRLSALPADVTVYPGHGLPTTIGAEPWLQGYREAGERMMSAYSDATLALFRTLCNQVIQTLEGMPEDAMANWRTSLAHGDVSTMYGLATHIAGAGEFWTLQAAGGVDQQRQRLQEFAASGSIESIRHRYDEWLARLETLLNSLSADDLDELCIREANPAQGVSGVEKPKAECILHALEHTALHLGHMQVQRQLWDQEQLTAQTS